MSEASLPTVFNPHPTIGALEIGVVVSSFLFGILTIQCYVFYERFPQDSRTSKLLVALLWLLELGHTICVCHATYTMTITDYGNPETLAKTPSSLDASVIVSGFIGPLVQAIFTRRIYRFTGKIYLPIFCWSLSFLRFIGCLVIGAECLMMDSLAQFERDWRWLVATILSMGAATDIIIALALCCYLRKQRNVAFGRTVDILDTLCRVSVQTGAVTSVAAISVVITFATMDNNFIWISLYTLLARCFSNSLLASLNGRSKLRDSLLVTNTTFLRTSDNGRMSNPMPVFKAGPVQITINGDEATETSGERSKSEQEISEKAYDGMD